MKPRQQTIRKSRNCIQMLCRTCSGSSLGIRLTRLGITYRDSTKAPASTRHKECACTRDSIALWLRCLLLLVHSSSLTLSTILYKGIVGTCIRVPFFYKTVCLSIEALICPAVVNTQHHQLKSIVVKDIFIVLWFT